MTTANLVVAANADDATERADGSNFTAGSVLLQADASTSASLRGVVGLRFVNGGIPQGAVITSATLAVRVANSNNDPRLDIHGELAATTQNFTDNADVIDRVRTAASVAWVDADLPAAFANAPDVATVVQEIVDQASWDETALTLILVGRNDAPSPFNIEAKEAGDPATLTVEWTVGGGGAAATNRIPSLPSIPTIPTIGGRA